MAVYDTYDDEQQRRQPPGYIYNPPGTTIEPAPPSDRTNPGDGTRGTDAPVSTAPPRSTTAPTSVDPFAGYNPTEVAWLRQNQNPDGTYDFHRLQEALAPTNPSRTQDSQSGFYDTRTHQALPGTPADPRRAIASVQNPQLSGAPSAPTAGGFQFDDPYTRRLEEILLSQLQTLTATPGYSPEELAVLRTQAIEPLEADRQASQRRSTERISARGMLPSSGLAELDSRDVDYQYDKLRGAVQRDLSVGAIDRRRQDQGRQIEVANLLYQLPRQAMMDNLAVINGTSNPNDVFTQALQLLNARTGITNTNNANNAAYWSQLGELFAELFA